MKKRPVIATIAFILLVALGAVAQQAFAQAGQKPVIIGVPLPLSGEYEKFGSVMKNSLAMAQKSINQGGAIGGRELKLIFADDKGREEAARGVIERLISCGAVMLVGGYASSPTYRMARIANDKSLPFLICAASADKITQQGWKFVFRLNPPVSEYTKGLEDFLVKEVKPRTMAVIYENDMYGTGGAMHMTEFCHEQAIAVTQTIGYEHARLSPIVLRGMLAPLKSAPPDVIYLVSYLEDAVRLAKTIRELKIPSILCGGGGGFTMEEFIAKAGRACEGLLTAALWSQHVRYPGAAEYFRSYQKQFKQDPDYHGAAAYSALLTAADALKRARSFSPGDIGAALSATYTMTPFGPVKFYNYYDYERQNSVNTLVLQVIDGRFQTVWPPEVSSGRYRPPAGPVP